VSHRPIDVTAVSIPSDGILWTAADPLRSSSKARRHSLMQCKLDDSQGAKKSFGNVDKPVLIAIGVYAVVGLTITRGVAADPGLTVLQKIVQVLIIWIVPLIGMCVVLLMQGNNHTRAEMKSLVPFPFYLASPSIPGDGSLAGSVQDGAGDHCGADAADGD